ncbi:hypothetical protein CYMTET_28314 [Cymbomonas tetramitiformis]|uniref:Uncharacterized protein n=1 Tax=Cymbomonas tetramitiformis TaxID=36881 RepID=A0AAE0FN65_9CHLO|nr:hypothetical protein CYMTET_28314 [Cymbomonas tetramitiformis]
MLHMCRSQQMFDALVPILQKEWVQHGEKRFSYYAFKEYLSAPYNVWFYSANRIPGADPSSQPIESYNAHTKQNKQMHMRAQLDEFLTTSLPNLLWLDSADLTGPIHRHVIGDLIPAELIEKALRYSEDDVLEHPAGSGHFFLNSKGHLGRKVKACHTEMYLKGVQGTAKVDNRTTSEKFQMNFMTLHKVYYDPSFELEEGEPAGLWRCDCKGFYHSDGRNQAPDQPLRFTKKPASQATAEDDEYRDIPYRGPKADLKKKQPPPKRPAANAGDRTTEAEPPAKRRAQGDAQASAQVEAQPASPRITPPVTRKESCAPPRTGRATDHLGLKPQPGEVAEIEQAEPTLLV